MGLSVGSNMDYNSVDINQSALGTNNKVEKPYVEVSEVLEPEFDKAIGKIKSELAKEGKTLELPKSIEEQKKVVYNYVWNIKLKEAREKGNFKEGIDVKYIDKGIFAIQSKDTKNISLFVDEKGEDLMNLSYRQEGFIENNGDIFPTTMKTMKEAGYYVDFGNGKRDVYKILGENKDGSFILDDLPLNIFSKEYYVAWKELIKIDDTLLILFTLKEGGENNKNSIDSYIKSGALTLKLLSLLNDKGLLGSGNLFEYAIIQMRVIESDVKKAFQKGEITSEQALKVYKVLPKENKDLSK